MLEMYFFRHGETDHNLRGIVQGGGIDSVLNETGKKQARAFYQAYCHLSFDAVYCSSLQRTRQTLQPWLDAGYSCEAHPGLNELSWGIQEGRKPSEAGRASYRATILQWQQGVLDACIEGGESPLDGWARAQPFFDRLLERHPEGRVLICSHGRQLRIILSMLLGQGLHKMESFASKNTALSIVKRYPDGKAHAELLNDTSHLAHLAEP